MNTAVTVDPVLPAAKALKLSTRKLKRHYFKLHLAIWEAKSFDPPRFLATPNATGDECFILLSDLETVSEELASRGVPVVPCEDAVSYTLNGRSKGLLLR